MNYSQLEHEVIFQTYNRFPLFIERGQQVWVWDEKGRKYLDFLGGIAVNALGHCHPAINRAIMMQAEKLGHTSNLYYTRPMLELARQLVRLSGLDKVFYANSGAEANEAAIKLARKFQPGKYEIITCRQSFHGRTLATITATGQPKYQKGFEPLVPGFRYVDYNNIEALEAAITDQTAAIMLEPIQGEGGVIIPAADYLPAVRHLCDEKKILLILDEVQTGCGRTGKFFCYEHSQVQPDVVTLAKALGGGLPIGVCIARNKVAAALGTGDHASTFGGHPVSCAAALAFLKIIETEKLIRRVEHLGRKIIDRFRKRLATVSAVKEIRGKGLMIGIELKEDSAGKVVTQCLERGLLLATAGSRVVRMLPPYIISDNHAELAVNWIVAAIKSL